MFLVIMCSALAAAAQRQDYIPDIYYDDWKEMPHDCPHVIVFYADWCAASADFEPKVRRLFNEYGDRAYFFWADVDTEEEWVADYGVPCIPCTYFIYWFDPDDPTNYKWRGEPSNISYTKLRDAMVWTLNQWNN